MYYSFSALSLGDPAFSQHNGFTEERKKHRTGNGSFIFSEMDDGQVPIGFTCHFPYRKSKCKGPHGGHFLREIIDLQTKKKSVSCHVPTNVIYPFKNGNLRLLGSDLLLAFAPGSLYFK